MDRPGIIGSRANNQLGGAGVSWDPQLVAIRVFDDRQPTESDPETCELADAGQLVAGLHWAIGRGVGVINLSMSMPGPPPEALARVAMEAFTNNVVLVAAAGNNGNSIKRYPAALRRTEVFGTTSPTPYTSSVISVGNTGRNDRRWSSSNYGSWVKVAAPGREILSTGLGGTYDLFTGTSQAAPIVSGIAQLLRSQEPGISTTDILARLKATGTPLAAGDQMGPRVDAFGATFNGSFEAALDTWTTSGTARSVRALGPIKPRHGKRMALVTNGPSNESVYGALVRGFFVDPVQRPTGMIEISFRYQYVTEEYPEFVGGKFNDKFQARLQTGSQEDIVIVEEEVNTTKWTRVSGIDFPGGDSTVGKSGWKRVTYTIEAERLVGENFLFFEVFDVADEIYDSAALIDDVRLRVVPQYPRNPPATRWAQRRASRRRT